MSAYSVGALVRDHRIAAGLSQAAVAKHLGLKQPSVAAIESGERKLSWEEGVALRELYYVDVDTKIHECTESCPTRKGRS